MAAVSGNRMYGTVYQSGSAARALPEIPERELRREKREQVKKARQEIEVRVREKRRAANEFSKVQMLSIGAALAVFIASVSFFLVCLSSQQSMKNDIERLEYQIQTTQHESAILRNLKNSSIDYDTVYRVATEELGMTIPMKQQVVHYQEPYVEFVHKYGDIPR